MSYELIMLLGGLHKSSLIDYPGKVSCVVFLPGCNFHCPYCQNPDLVKADFTASHFINENTFLDFLERRRGFLDGVVISGGEPTIHDDLASLCRKIRRLGYPVKLDTNGSRPMVIKKLIEEGIVDYIAMDIKTDPSKYSPTIKKDLNPDCIFYSIKIIMETAKEYEFRTTCVKPIVNELIIENIAKIIKGSMLYALQRFNKTVILEPGFYKENETCFDDKELMYLKSIAEPWVKKCIVR